MQTLHSNQIVVMDTTDDRKLDIYITSNLPTNQIYDTNRLTYSPDWTETNLQLGVDAYLDSMPLSSGVTYRWYRKIGTSDRVFAVAGNTLSIYTNELSGSNNLITYICEAAYQGNLTAHAQITFTRVDTGLNGVNGSDAPRVLAQYSVDGGSWTNTLNASVHKYIRFSYNNGSTWTVAIKMTGEDGTSVTIVGTAYYNGTFTNDNIGQSVVLYSDPAFTTQIITTSLSTGDAYIVNGYLCVYNADSDNFICVGTIKGPPGNDGISSYIYIRYGTDINGANMSVNPDGKMYMGLCTSNSTVAPTNASAYTWRKFVGDDAKSITLHANNQVFKVGRDNIITPSTITVTAQTSNTTISEWLYSTDGGQTFSSTVPSGVSRISNQITITGVNINSGIISLSVKASDGICEDVLTVYKLFDGVNGIDGDDGLPASIAFLTNENITFNASPQGEIRAMTAVVNVVSYTGSTKVTPTIGSISGLPEGMTINTANITTSLNEISIPLTIAANATLGTIENAGGQISIPVISPVTTILHLHWNKINAGMSGEKGEDAVTFQVYSTNGYVLSKNVPTIILQTLAHNGSTVINAGATYRWYSSDGAGWSIINDATDSYLQISHADILFNKSYMCEMTFNDAQYIGVVTIDDKNDINNVFTIKPTSYSEGDIWIVGADYVPPLFERGMVLRADHTNKTYTDSDWIAATRYDENISEMRQVIERYNQHFFFDVNNGIIMTATNQDGQRSDFSTILSNTKLAFKQGEDEVAYISNNKMYISEAEIVSPLSVTGKYSGNTMLQPPTINMGNYSIVVESNGSLSIISNI